MASSATRHGLQAVAAACLAAAYLWAGQWLVLPALVVLGAGWVLIGRNSTARASRWLLAGTTGLAAIGAVMDLSMILIVVGIVAGLAAWDLSDFDATLKSSARAVDRSRLMSLHMRWLVPALAAGMLLALLASISNLDLPFAVAAASAAILVLSVTRAAGQLMGAQRE